MPNRKERIRIAEDTMEILKRKKYSLSNGIEIDLSEKIDEAINNSILYKPNDDIVLKIDDKVKRYKNTTIEITSETTLEAAKRLIVKEGLKDTVCLNFASAKNPGGGFLSGSQAQEESLARSSALYSSLEANMEMYKYNRKYKTGLYSDYMIYSPRVPVFKDDDGKLLDKPYEVSFITAPSVNAGVVIKQEKENIGNIEGTMINRIRKILLVAAVNEEKSIILGAYGCGVFKNRPIDVAKYFKKILIDENLKAMFKRVTFAIYDNSANKQVIKAFQKILG